MMRSLRFTVTPAPAGWLLFDGDQIIELLSSQSWAVKAACGLAYRRHVDTGEMTTVLIRQNDGSTEIAGCYD